MTRSTTRLIERARHHGFTLGGEFSVAAYNTAVSADLELPGDGGTAVLLGNTRELWPHFMSALRSEPHWLDSSDPLDRWCEATVARLVADLGTVRMVRFAHSPPPERVAVQRAAELAGLAWTSASYLSVHPVYGPWVAWRAIVVFDEPAVASPARVPRPCDGCGVACEPALQRALAVTATLDATSVRAEWTRWLEVRDACPVGRAWRYDDLQLEYHYTANVQRLRDAL